jgi:DNA-binding NarL/FixJ family response regulator
MRSVRKTRVLLAENNADLRNALQRMIDDEADLVCVASTGLLGEVAGLAERHDADVVVLDLELDGGSALPLLATIRSARPEIRCLIYSGHSNAALKRGAIKAGASAYVSKSGDIDALTRAIRDSVRT